MACPGVPKCPNSPHQHHVIPGFVSLCPVPSILSCCPVLGYATSKVPWVSCHCPHSQHIVLSILGSGTRHAQSVTDLTSCPHLQHLVLSPGQCHTSVLAPVPCENGPWGYAVPGLFHVPVPRTRCSPLGSHQVSVPIPILTSLSLSPALGPVPQVRGCHDQVQRGAGGFPGAEQGPDPAPAGNQCVTKPPGMVGGDRASNPALSQRGRKQLTDPSLTKFS